MNPGKYKTVLCKHFGQNGTCSYGDKCQFAHGFQELKNSSNPTGIPDQGSMMQTSQPSLNMTKVTPNPANYKIVKCRTWESTGSCKYGSVCTFAHGDNELRTKSDNNLQMSDSAVTMDSNFQSNLNPYLMQDPNFVYNMMLQQQMMMGGMNYNSNMNMNDMYSMYGMNPQQNQAINSNYPIPSAFHQYPSDQEGQNEVNLNDQNAMFFQNQMMQGVGKEQDPNSLNNENNIQGYNNMNTNNMFMKK